MSSKIILKKSSVVAKVPVVADLEFGELALNYSDSKLYFKKADGLTIEAFAVSAASGTVTSVGITPGTGISVSNSPITSSGDISVTNTAPNVTTNITTTHNTTTVSVNSSDGTNGTLNAATTSLAGVMTSTDKSKLDGVASGAQVNVATNLTYTTASTTGTVNSSTGTNATIPAATTSLAGVMTSTDKSKLDGVASGATNVTNTNQLTNGSGFATGGGTASGTNTGDQTAISGNAGTATTLLSFRTINGVSFNGSANITVEPYVEDAVATSVTRYITFVDNSTAGFKRLNEDANLAYNPGTNVLTVPTVSGALSGNATTATTLQTARTINGVSFNGSANITVAASDGTKLPLTGGTTTGTINAPTFNATSTAGGGFQGIDADTITTPSFTWTADLNTGMYRPAADTIGFTTGGVNRVTINSAGISGAGAGLTGLNGSNISSGTIAAARVATLNQNTTGSSSSCTGNAATATNASNTSSITNATGSSFTWTGIANFQSNQNTTGSNPPLQAYSSSGGAIMAFHRSNVFAINMGLDSDNVFRIGGWSAAANRLQMDMSGNLTMAGNVTAYSDERLKKDWEEVKPNFVDQLANVKSGTYTRTDSDERQAGVSAQSLQELLPETVIAGSDGMLSVAYGNAALLSAVELAKRVIELEERIVRLEKLLSNS